MKFVIGFMVLLLDALLWLLPVNAAVQSFRTDQITNAFTCSVTVSGNVTATLSQAVFDLNTSLITVSSNNTADTPTVAGLDATGRVVSVAGLVPSETAILTIQYAADGFLNEPVWQGMLSFAPYVWILLLCVLPVIAVVVIIKG
jgi:hypothetical protein